MKATLTNYRQSPRKVRLIASAIKGKSVPEAQNLLETLPKRGAGPLLKLLKSAIANAKQTGLNPENLFIESATVNQGIVLKRFRPRAFGRAYLIRKKTSHVKISLAERNKNEKNKKGEKKKDNKKKKNQK